MTRWSISFQWDLEISSDTSGWHKPCERVETFVNACGWEVKQLVNSMLQIREAVFLFSSWLKHFPCSWFHIFVPTHSSCNNNNAKKLTIKKISVPFLQHNNSGAELTRNEPVKFCYEPLLLFEIWRSWNKDALNNVEWGVKAVQRI